MVENIVGKGENADYEHFLLFPQFFPKGSCTGSLKVVIVWKRVNYSKKVSEMNVAVNMLMITDQ